MPQDVRRAVERDAGLRLGQGERALSEADHLLQKRIVEGLLLSHQGQELLANGRQSHAREVDVQVVGAGLELVCAQPLVELDDLLGHEAGRCDHHHEDAPVRERHQVDVAEAGARDVRSDDEADVPAQTREKTRGVLHDLLGRGVLGREGGRHRGRVAGRERVAVHQAVHEEAVAVVGRNTPGTRVRVVEIPEGLEVGHDVPQRGRRQSAVDGSREALRADRLAGLDVKLDQSPEDLSPAIVKGCCEHTLLWKLYGGKEKRQALDFRGHQAGRSDARPQGPAGPPPRGDMSLLPLNVAPSTMITRGARMFPVSRPVASRWTR